MTILIQRVTRIMEKSNFINESIEFTGWLTSQNEYPHQFRVKIDAISKGISNAKESSQYRA